MATVNWNNGNISIHTLDETGQPVGNAKQLYGVYNVKITPTTHWQDNPESAYKNLIQTIQTVKSQYKGTFLEVLENAPIGAVAKIEGSSNEGYVKCPDKLWYVVKNGKPTATYGYKSKNFPTSGCYLEEENDMHKSELKKAMTDAPQGAQVYNKYNERCEKGPKDKWYLVKANGTLDDYGYSPVMFDPHTWFLDESTLAPEMAQESLADLMADAMAGDAIKRKKGVTRYVKGEDGLWHFDNPKTGKLSLVGYEASKFLEDLWEFQLPEIVKTTSAKKSKKISFREQMDNAAQGVMVVGNKDYSHRKFVKLGLKWYEIFQNEKWANVGHTSDVFPETGYKLVN